ncbi:ubiquinol-cytochrome-c reductase complex assembly factor 1 isoform X2 [Ixodes scapularis]|uniref:ubiquinol-cytochrome-c reductase complex assembly factor 1 isoform X2 n=1 Tax=Ixodes scapularis TaxID=6945 RepID=UPI0011616AA6|nr:ubiquinol-cytochrome-c reductase complex assembly factor 1 isoform X2 [Ixodes scapularis]
MNLLALSHSLRPLLTRSLCYECRRRLPSLMEASSSLQTTRVFHLAAPREETRKAAVYIYESCVDRVDFATFFTYLKLPDTFLSWFFVTELHLWMCMTRAMAEPDERRATYLQSELVRSLWSDTEARLKKLGSMSSSIKREALQDLCDHFNAALLLYDEGAQGDDKALAGALWRVMLMCEGNDPSALETLVCYVRRQMHRLDGMTIDEFTKEDNLSWTPLLECRPDNLQ